MAKPQEVATTEELIRSNEARLLGIEELYLLYKWNRVVVYQLMKEGRLTKIKVGARSYVDSRQAKALNAEVLREAGLDPDTGLPTGAQPSAAQIERARANTAQAKKAANASVVSRALNGRRTRRR